MQFPQYLAREWRPALGCTEPASVAYATALAAAQGSGEVQSVHLVCDPRIYKNCYAVGIPHSEGKTGIRWALALGAVLADPTLELECFSSITPELLAAAARLIEAGAITVEVAPNRDALLVDSNVVCSGGSGRAVIEFEHTRVTQVERGGSPARPPEASHASDQPSDAAFGAWLDALAIAEAVELARSIGPRDRELLRTGCERNVAIAEHGLSLFPEAFLEHEGSEGVGRLTKLVCAGVHARMCGESFTVMTLAGSGNKGITVSVPLALHGRESGVDPERVDEALALACLMTSQTTRRLGTLSAVCGSVNAAGIGLAVGLVLLKGGGLEEMSMAINNMVGSVTGVICDGAKIGCGLKAMTGVDAAFRASSLAMSGVGIPMSDGIVGVDGSASLQNLERVAKSGMTAMDAEILGIMQEKLRWSTTEGARG